MKFRSIVIQVLSRDLTPSLLRSQVYYPVTSALVQQLVASMQRLGFAPNTNLEQRK